jgi:hypothetical protein
VDADGKLSVFAEPAGHCNGLHAERSVSAGLRNGWATEDVSPFRCSAVCAGG